MKTLTLLLLLPLTVFADVVVPIDEVQNSVNIRLNADATSDIVGELRQGASIELVRSQDGWHEVKLEGGANGFISADWSRIVKDTATPTDDSDTAANDIADEASTAAIATAVADDASSEAELAESDSADTPEETKPRVEAIAVDAVATEDVVDDTAAEQVVDVAAPATEEAEQPDTGEAVELTGTRNYLVRFRGEHHGGNSQIFDNGNRVGIGTVEPKQRLEVNGSIQIHEQNSSVAGLMITQSTGETGYIMHNRASTLTIGAGSIDRITIDRDGNVGLAVARPSHPLQLASGAHVTAGGVWTNSSSRTNKENIQVLSAEQASQALMALDPVTFSYRAEPGEDYVGFIAEDVPELLASRDRDALSAMDIVAVLTRVVQQQQQQINALQRRLDAHQGL